MLVAIIETKHYSPSSKYFFSCRSSHFLLKNGLQPNTFAAWNNKKIPQTIGVPKIFQSTQSKILGSPKASALINVKRILFLDKNNTRFTSR